MTPETQQWLKPMVDAADEATVEHLFHQSTVPADDSGGINVAWIAGYFDDTPQAKVSATDWIHFGQRLREHLGWDHYPSVPATTQN